MYIRDLVSCGAGRYSLQYLFLTVLILCEMAQGGTSAKKTSSKMNKRHFITKKGHASNTPSPTVLGNATSYTTIQMDISRNDGACANNTHNVSSVELSTVLTGHQLNWKQNGNSSLGDANNSSLPSSTTNRRRCHWAWTHTLIILTMLVIGLAGAFGNVLVIGVFRKRRQPKASSVYILNLALVDGVTCLVLMPLIPFMLVCVTSLPVSFFAVVVFLTSVALLNSCLLMVAIAYDRYNAVCKPMTFTFKDEVRAKKICLACFISSLLLTSVEMIRFGPPQVRKSYVLFKHIFLDPVIPIAFTLIAIFYALVFKAVHKRNRVAQQSYKGPASTSTHAQSAWQDTVNKSRGHNVFCTPIGKFTFLFSLFYLFMYVPIHGSGYHIRHVYCRKIR